MSRPVIQEKWRTWLADVPGGRAWWTCLVDDRQFVDRRPDVLTYTSEALTAPVRVSGTPVVHLYASTSGTDSDSVVKVIDVYPENAADPAMSGYEVSMQCMAMSLPPAKSRQSRYRESIKTRHRHPRGTPLSS
jgi:predicted acyl esterase